MQPHAFSLHGSQSSPSPPRTDGRGSLSDPGGSEVDMMIQAASTSTGSGGVRWPAPEEISALGDPGSTSRDEDSLLSRRAAFASTDGSCSEENPTPAERILVAVMVQGSRFSRHYHCFIKSMESIVCHLITRAFISLLENMI